MKKRNHYCENCKTSTTKQIQKGVDVSLATDILRHGFQKSCDICIIASGDEDYKDAMDLIKDIGRGYTRILPLLIIPNFSWLRRLFFCFLITKILAD